MDAELNMLKLLISPIDEPEALEAIAGGADIIDVKNPKEGSLGANFPWVIKRIRQIASENIEVSCTLGDLPNLPGSASLAALGAASTGVNYVKGSLYHLETFDDSVYMMKNIARAVKAYDPSIKVAVTGYADAKRVGSIDPLTVPEIASRAGCDVAMIDTAVKDGKNLLTFLNANQLKGFIDNAHGLGLKAALAGSLKKENLPLLCDLGVDIIGLRGAACAGGNRIDGRIRRENVRDLTGIVRNAEIHAR